MVVPQPPPAPTGPLQIKESGQRWVVMDQRTNRVLLTRPLINMLGDLDTLQRLDRMRTRTTLSRTALLSTGTVLVVASMVNLGSSGPGEPDGSDFTVNCEDFRNVSRCEAEQEQLDLLFGTALSSFRAHRSWTSLAMLGVGTLAFVAVPFASWEYRDANYSPGEVYSKEQLQQWLDKYNTRISGGAQLEIGPGWIAVSGTLP